MPLLLGLAGTIDRLTATLGRAVAWFTLCIVLLQFALVIGRYAFGFGSIQLSESVEIRSAQTAHIQSHHGALSFSLGI